MRYFIVQDDIFTHRIAYDVRKGVWWGTENLAAEVLQGILQTQDQEGELTCQFRGELRQYKWCTEAL
jgi:hypothetical protein